MNLWPRLLIGLVVATLLRAGLVLLVPQWADLFEPFIVVVIWLAVAIQPLPAQVAGMVLGLAFDVFSGRPFGIGGFAGTLVGYLVARFAQHLLVRQPRTLVLVFALAIATQRVAIAAIEVLLIPGAVVPSPERAAMTVVATTVLGIVWGRAEVLFLDRLLGWKRERASRLRLG